MAVQSFLRDLDGLFNYSTDENPTSQQDYQEAVKNWVDTVKSLVDCTLWQPDTEYAAGNVLRTPSLPYELQLTCITAGTSGSAEPDYTDVSLGDTITDGTVTWVVDGYLPLAGGTMSGDIEFNGANSRKFVIESTDDGKNFNVGWDANNSDGAFLGFRSSDFTNREGEFYLSAKNSSTEVALRGNTTGSLTWATKEVVTKKDEDISSSVSFTTNNGTITSKKIHKVGNVVQGTFTIRTASAVSVGGTITGSISGLPTVVGNMNTSGVTFYGTSVVILTLGSTSYSVRVNASQLAANVDVVLPFTYATVS